MCCSTGFDIRRESIFTLTFSLAAENGELAHIDTPAKIVWYTFDEQKQLYTAGVEFLGLKEKPRESLRRVLQSLTPK